MDYNSDQLGIKLGTASQARSQGGRRGEEREGEMQEEDSPSTRLKQVQFALNNNMLFLMLYLKTTGLKSSSFHRFYIESSQQNF